MTRYRSRVPHFLLLHVLIISLVPTVAPSEPRVPALLSDAPAADEIAFFEELAGWIETEEQPDRSMRQAIRQSDTFDVFCAYHEEEAKSSRLKQVPFGEAIERIAADQGVDGLLVASVVQAESNFNPHAVSHRGAVGLMQLMPATAAPVPVDRLTEPNLNLQLGTRYLRQLLERYGGDLELALAAYNAGPGNVQRYGGLPPFQETRHYVEKVLRLYVDHHREVWRESETGEFLIAG